MPTDLSLLVSCALIESLMTERPASAVAAVLVVMLLSARVEYEIADPN